LTDVSISQLNSLFSGPPVHHKFHFTLGKTNYHYAIPSFYSKTPAWESFWASSTTTSCPAKWLKIYFICVIIPSSREDTAVQTTTLHHFATRTAAN